MRNKFMKQVKKSLINKYGQEKAKAIIDVANKRYTELYQENINEPKAMHMHTRVKIYPCISVLDAQVNNGINREEALDFMFKFIEWRSHNAKNIVTKIMKLPGLYKHTPIVFGNMTKKNFGRAANFDAVFHEISKREMRFDMTKCPYADICRKYGYPEITKAFCRGDDIIYANMHPKIIWGRTKTIGDGDNICDFKITVEE